MENNIIETFNLSKKYYTRDKKSISALDDINISIKKGEKFGLLGPNGAGKTTMISILTTLIQPTSGYAIVDSINILKKPQLIRNRISLMLGSDMIYYRITGYDNLKFFCKVYEIPNYREKIQNIAREFALEEWLHDYVEHYSTGMKVKLALCRVLLSNPKILFLDEPVAGLDIKTTNDIIKKLKELDKTIFITSHNMNIIEKLCTRIAFINKGKIIKIGDIDELRRIMQKEIRISIEINQDKDRLKQELNNQDFILEFIEKKDGFLIYLKERENYNQLFSMLSRYSVLKIKEIEPSIEDLFLKIV